MPRRAMTKAEKIDFLDRQMSAKSSRGLELGPSTKPMFRRSNKYDVMYLESVDTEGLQARARESGGDPAAVEHVDFVLDRDKTLPALVADAAPFDYVTSSHVIEHIPNPIQHLKEVAAILKQGGHYGLLVPDRNLCFDCMRPLTTLGQIVEAFVEPRSTARLAARIDDARYGAKLASDNRGAWAEADIRIVTPKYANRMERVSVLAAFAKARSMPWFGHQWTFSPRSFISLFYDLRALGLTEFHLKAIQPTGHMDFIVVLAKVASGLSFEDACEQVARYAPRSLICEQEDFLLDT